MSKRERNQDGELDAMTEDWRTTVRYAEVQAPDSVARTPARERDEAGPDGLRGQRSKGERPGNHRPR